LETLEESWTKESKEKLWADRILPIARTIAAIVAEFLIRLSVHPFNSAEMETLIADTVPV